MLGVYVPAKFAIPENPVMRAFAGAPILMTATEQKGVTGLPTPGLGCGCSSKIPSFGMGNVGDEGLRLYGDWYGAQQHGGMILNGDRNGLGTYFPSDAHGYRGFSGLGAHRASGLGDLETMLGNVTAGNYGAALSGNDIASSLPNWLVIGGAAWFLLTIYDQQKRARYSAGRFVGRVKGRRKGTVKTDWSE